MFALPLKHKFNMDTADRCGRSASTVSSSSGQQQRDISEVDAVGIPVRMPTTKDTRLDINGPFTTTTTSIFSRPGTPFPFAPIHMHEQHDHDHGHDHDDTQDAHSHEDASHDFLRVHGDNEYIMNEVEYGSVETCLGIEVSLDMEGLREEEEEEEEEEKNSEGRRGKDVTFPSAQENNAHGSSDASGLEAPPALQKRDSAISGVSMASVGVRDGVGRKEGEQNGLSSNNNTSSSSSSTASSSFDSGIGSADTLRVGMGSGSGSDDGEGGEEREASHERGTTVPDREREEINAVLAKRWKCLAMRDSMRI